MFSLGGILTKLGLGAVSLSNPVGAVAGILFGFIRPFFNPMTWPVLLLVWLVSGLIAADKARIKANAECKAAAIQAELDAKTKQLKIAEAALAQSEADEEAERLRVEQQQDAIEQYKKDLQDVEQKLAEKIKEDGKGVVERCRPIDDLDVRSLRGITGNQAR